MLMQSDRGVEGQLSDRFWQPKDIMARFPPVAVAKNATDMIVSGVCALEAFTYV